MDEQKPEPEGTKQPEPKPKTIGDEIDLFFNQVDALAETLPLAAAAVQGARSKSNQELSKFLLEECSAEKKGHRTIYTFDSGQVPRFQRYQRRVQKAELAQLLVPRGLLVALVSQFDAYLGALMRQLFLSRPEILDASGKQLTYSQLVEFGSIEAAKGYIVEKEIESVLRENHNEHFSWLESKLKIPLRDLPAWPVFLEVTERRNLFVHTNGIVSRRYLDVCSKYGCPVPDGVKVGDSLSLTRDYFTSSYECILEMGVKLGQVLWRKITPTDIENADANLSAVTYTLLAEGRYRLARVLLDFAVDLKKHSSEDARLRFVVNRAQAYKWSSDEEKCKQILGEEDWTATSSRFRLARAVLRDKFDEALAIVGKIGVGDPYIDKHAFREWPIFKELRKHAEFLALFKKIFGEPLNTFEVEDLPPGASRPN